MATALIAGTVGCSNAAGGNNTEFDNGGTGGNGGGGNQGYQKPDYMNVTEEFGGQRFAAEKANLQADINRDATFGDYNTNAKKFMTNEVATLKELWKEQDTDSSTLSNQINKVLNNYNKKDAIADNIDNNYTVLAPMFNAMRDGFTSQDYHSFNVTYWKLAADAYNQSLGGYAGETTFTTNYELRNKSTNYFVQELNYTSLNYAQATDSLAATNRMNNYLNTIATKTNTNVKVLKRIMQLALYNESLYGLNDHAVRASVNNSGLKSTPRSLATFDNVCDNVVTNMQSIDDRTM